MLKFPKVGHSLVTLLSFLILSFNKLSWTDNWMSEKLCDVTKQSTPLMASSASAIQSKKRGSMYVMIRWIISAKERSIPLFRWWFFDHFVPILFSHLFLVFREIASGCFHNNTMFADTSIIPSTEPCLLCKCSNKNLVCVRRVCKDQVSPWTSMRTVRKKS